MPNLTVKHQCGHEELHQAGKGDSLVLAQFRLSYEPCTRCLRVESYDAAARNLCRGLRELSGTRRHVARAEVIRDTKWAAMEHLAQNDAELQQRLKPWRTVTTAREWLAINDMHPEEMLARWASVG